MLSAHQMTARMTPSAAANARLDGSPAAAMHAHQYVCCKLPRRAHAVCAHASLQQTPLRAMAAHAASAHRPPRGSPRRRRGRCPYASSPRAPRAAPRAAQSGSTATGWRATARAAQQWTALPPDASSAGGDARAASVRMCKTRRYMAARVRSATAHVVRPLEDDRRAPPPTAGHHHARARTEATVQAGRRTRASGLPGSLRFFA
jgi:hypothetical protein